MENAMSWGSLATPPAALAFQQRQQLLKRLQQPPLRRASSPARPPPVYDGGPNGYSSSGTAQEERLPRLSGREAGGGRLLLALSGATGDGGNKGYGGDIWRDSALRYAGYANEVGESFRNIAPRLVGPSYAVSMAYVFGDAIDKGYQKHLEGKGGIAVAKIGLDVLLWQTLASVAIPGLTINLTVKAMNAAMASGQAERSLSKAARKWAPTAVGLGIIPLIVKPIDEAVTWWMTETVRKWLN